VVIAAFSNVWLAAGHGIGLIGLLMVTGSTAAWGLPRAIGWAGVLALMILPLMPWRLPYIVLTAIGLGGLTVSLLLFVSRSEAPGLALVSACVFFGAVIARAVYLLGQVKTRGLG
jgi:hypothetical protein